MVLRSATLNQTSLHWGVGVRKMGCMDEKDGYEITLLWMLFQVSGYFYDETEWMFLFSTGVVINIFIWGVGAMEQWEG